MMLCANATEASIQYFKLKHFIRDADEKETWKRPVTDRDESFWVQALQLLARLQTIYASIVTYAAKRSP